LPEFKCGNCGSSRFEPGVLNAKGMAGIVFTPTDSSRMTRWFIQGAAVRALVCRDCGVICLRADQEKIEDLTGEGHSRCRKCRHILKGLSQPRCPECGEPI
jgi:hypothetical protein